MYIQPYKRTHSNLTTRRGYGLDYLGRKPAPTSPNEDPYWTLRVDIHPVTEEKEKKDNK